MFCNLCFYLFKVITFGSVVPPLTRPALLPQIRDGLTVRRCVLVELLFTANANNQNRDAIIGFIWQRFGRQMFGVRVHPAHKFNLYEGSCHLLPCTCSSHKKCFQWGKCHSQSHNRMTNYSVPCIPAVHALNAKDVAGEGYQK